MIVFGYSMAIELLMHGEGVRLFHLIDSTGVRHPFELLLNGTINRMTAKGLLHTLTDRQLRGMVRAYR